MKLVCLVSTSGRAELRASVLANHSSNSDFRSVYFTPKLGLERVTLPSGLQTLAVSEFPLELRASDTPSGLQTLSFGFQVSS